MTLIRDEVRTWEVFAAAPRCDYRRTSLRFAICGAAPATKELLALEDRPTCILFSDDYAYIGGNRAITEAGLKIPEDISVVGYDGIHMAKVISPRLTTWEQNTKELGRIALDKLIERIENPRTAIPEHIVVEGRLLEGETVRQI